MAVTVIVERERLGPLLRINLRIKVTGRVRHITDMGKMDALYVKAVKSTQAHAKIRSLNISEARLMLDVKRVITHDDISGENLISFFTRDQPLQAKDVTRFAGEALALVVSHDPLTGKMAVDSIKVEYEELPAVLDIYEALDPKSIKLGKDGNIKERYQANGEILQEKLAEFQVHEGVMQGLGYALTEDLAFKDGKPLSNSLLDYIIPTFADIPNIQVDFVETYNEDGPYGAKGLGEVPFEPVAPTVGNAILNAIGRSIRDFPFTPVRVFAVLEPHAKGNHSEANPDE
ncbi:MAG: xanthine dehydrogenase family protein [Conexivisphaerales archaeon]